MADQVQASTGLKALSDEDVVIDFDIVISDIRMGKIDGIQVMEKVLETSPNLVVIMITGYADLPGWPATRPPRQVSLVRPYPSASVT